mgnify:CR=1 FL=1
MLRSACFSFRDAEQCYLLDETTVVVTDGRILNLVFVKQHLYALKLTLKENMVI